MSGTLVKKFLRSVQLDAEQIDMHQETEAILRNMRQGLRMHDVQMHMFPSYVEVGRAIPVNETCLVLDAGGTNLRVAALTFNERFDAIVEHFATYKMPGLKEECGRDEFFDQLVDYLQPILPLSRKIGFCFSFATEMQANKDGRPLPFSKELKLTEVVGELLGENIRSALQRAGHKQDVDVLVLNDAVAALLGGIQQAGQQQKEFSSFIGFILGTGTNTAYVEKNKNISKISGFDPEGCMVMNCESGTYPIANRSPIDVAVDNDTQIPGDHLFEKLISGRYKGPQLLYTLRSAAEQGLFSPGCQERLSGLDHLETRELTVFLNSAHGNGILAGIAETEEDRLVIYHLIENLEDRAARLVCCNWAAVLEQMAAGRDPLRPVAITVDGSTYFKSALFKTRVDYYIQAFLREKMSYHVDIIPSDNSNLVGAAVAALTNF